MQHQCLFLTRGLPFAKLSAIKKTLDAAGLSVNTAACNLHSNKMFRAGGLTNPDPKIRRLARRKVERALRLGAFFGAKYFTYWVARDGFEVPITTDWSKVYQWIAQGLDGVNDYITKHKLTNYIGGTIEPKPNEPRGHMFLPNSGHAVGFIQSCLKKPKFWGINPELLQHESMALINSVQTVGYLVATKKLFFLHYGSQIKGQFDNDFPPLVGPEGLKESVQIFWALEKLGWKGVVEFDCHMLRTDGDPDDPIECRRAFIVNCIKALSISIALAKRLRNFDPAGLSDSQADLAATMALCALEEKDLP